MITFVVFSLRRAWQGFWRNALMSLAATATMVLMLMLLAGFWILQTGPPGGPRLHRIEGRGRRPTSRTTTKPDEVDGAHGRASRRCPRSTSVTYVTRGGGARALPSSARRSRASEDLTKYLDDEPAARQPRGQAGRSRASSATSSSSSARSRPSERAQGATDDRRQRHDGHRRPADGRHRRPRSSSRSSSCSSSSTRSGWPSSPGPRRSRSCGSSARRTRSSAGRSSSRGRWSGCSARRSRSACSTSPAEPIGGFMIDFFRVLPLSVRDARPRPRRARRRRRPRAGRARLVAVGPDVPDQ